MKTDYQKIKEQNVKLHPENYEMTSEQKKLQAVNTGLTMPTERNLVHSVAAYNRNTKKATMGMEILHSYYNHKQIWEDIHEGTGRDVGQARIETPEPALIVGSGQSLDKAHDLLKDWKGAIFSSTSQATTLIHTGKHDRLYFIALDPKLNVDEFVGMDDWAKYDATLVIQPCIAPIIFDIWKNKKLYFRIMEPMTEFYTQNLSIAYRFIPTFLYLFSCSLSAQLGLAAAMGYNPLILVGCDFGAPNNKYRFTRWDCMPTDITTVNKETGDKKHYTHFSEIPKDLDLITTVHKREWQSTTGDAIPSEKEVMSNNGVITDALQLYYKRSLFCVARLDMKDIINTSTEGIITEMPEATIEEVIENQGQGLEDRYLTTIQKQHVYERYLASQHTYAVRFKEKGIRFIETTDPVKEVPGFLAMLKKTAKGNLNIPKNIKRITGLKEWAVYQKQLHQQLLKNTSQK